jgi:tetratricopeptide (TPR) repeat protein
MYSKQGLDQKALVAFDRANKISKFSKTPRYNLSRLYLSYGLTEIAIPIFQSLLNYSPTDVDLLNSLGTAYLIQSDLEKSISYFNKIPKNFWVKPEIGLNLSLVYKRSGKFNEAKKVFDSITYPKDEKIKKYFEFVKDQIGET